MRHASLLRMTITSFFSGLLHLFSQKNSPFGLWGLSRSYRWKTNPILKDETEKIAVSISSTEAGTITSIYSRTVLRRIDDRELCWRGISCQLQEPESDSKCRNYIISDLYIDKSISYIWQTILNSTPANLSCSAVELIIFSFQHVIETLKQCQSVFLPTGGILFAFMPVETLSSPEKSEILGKLKGDFNVRDKNYRYRVRNQ